MQACMYRKAGKERRPEVTLFLRLSLQEYKGACEAYIALA